jgi:hypoxanthine phosphoribosyltransferase
MKKTYINNRDYKGLVSQLGRKIATSGWRPDYIVGITRGGLYPALLLSHYLDVPMQTLSVQLRDSVIGPESNLWMAEEAFGYHSVDGMRGTSNPELRKNILLVDDINDSGETFNWIMEDWEAGCLPKDPAWDEIWNHNVKFAVTIDNLASKCRVKMDFAGMEINKSETPEWIVFPWEEWWAR